jgi:hypothetical protein
MSVKKKHGNLSRNIYSVVFSPVYVSFLDDEKSEQIYYLCLLSANQQIFRFGQESAALVGCAQRDSQTRYNHANVSSFHNL